MSNITTSALVDEAARYSLLLGWLKAVDWEADKPALYKTGIRKLLDRKTAAFLPYLPIKTADVINEYAQLAKNNSRDFPKVRKMSARLAGQIGGELCGQAEPRQFANYPRIFEWVGEIISLADPLLDLETDLSRNEYNPIADLAEKNHTGIEAEYQNLRAEYEAAKNKTLKALAFLPSADSAFVLAMQQSFSNLSRKIACAAESLFGIAAASQEEDEDKKKKKKNACSDFCYLCDCDCCPSFGNCCSSGGEGGGNCCCGGCDC